MPPKARVTRGMVVDAAVDVIRQDGHESLSARTIAGRLGCSTQPVLYSFKSIDEIREAAYRSIDEYHTTYIMPAELDDPAPLLSIGLNYVRFAHEQPNLFRFLFQTNKFGGMNIESLMADPALAGVLEVVSDALGMSEGEAREAFLTLFALAHGLASLLANNAMGYDEQRCTKMLESVFRGVRASQKEE